jgi:hypothetical protein
MAKFTSTADLEMQWNSYYFNDVAGTQFWIPDSAKDQFTADPGPMIEGLAWPVPIDPVDGGSIDPGTIDLAAFVASVRPIVIVAVLPTLPDASYPPGCAVTLTTDGKLYRNDSDVWTTSVDGADVEVGTLYGDRIVAGTIDASALATIFLLASTILTATSGSRVELDSAGMRCLATDGTVLVNLPTDGSPASFAGQIQANTLQVLGAAEFDGLNNFFSMNSLTYLQAGVTTPSSAPILTQGLAAPLALEHTAGYTIPNGCYGSYDTAGGSTGAIACFISVERDASYNPYVTEWKVSDGTVSRRTAILDTYGYGPMSVVRLGTYWYVVCGDGKMRRITRTTGAFAAGDVAISSGAAGIATDGTYLYIVSTNGTTLRFDKYSSALAFVSFVSVASALYPADLWIRDAGDGHGVCFWVNLGTSGSASKSISQYTSAAALIGTLMAAGPGTSSGGNGLFFDGTNWRQAIGYSLYLFTNWVGGKAWVGYAWYDSVGTTHETPVGPRGSLTVQVGRQLNITVPPVPVGGAGADDPDRVRVYAYVGAADPGAGNFHLQFQSTGTAYTMTNYDSGGAADGAGTAFPGSTGAVLKAANAGWELHGNGDALIKVLTLNIDRPWVFEMGSSGAGAYLIWRPTTNAKRVRIQSEDNSNFLLDLLPDDTAANGAMGFFGTAAITKPTVSGSRGGNAALGSLLTALDNLGLIKNSTTT